MENSNIAWTDNTFSPWVGCTAVSDACKFCYAEALVQRYGGDFSVRRRTSAANWAKVKTWNRKASEAGVQKKVFCSSLADVFDNQVDEEWRADLWMLIHETPWLTWQLLTKRPQNIQKMLPQWWDKGWKNVWLGTTVENQEEADRRIPHLLRVPAYNHFLSCEPLLGPLDLSAYKEGISWVICGGESGQHFRTMDPSWAWDLLDQCENAGIPFFMKQMSGNSKKALEAIPPELKIRQFPETVT